MLSEEVSAEFESQASFGLRKSHTTHAKYNFKTNSINGFCKQGVLSCFKAHASTLSVHLHFYCMELMREFYNA